MHFRTRRLTVTNEHVVVQSLEGPNSLVIQRSSAKGDAESRGRLGVELRKHENSGRVRLGMDIECIFGVFELVAGPQLAVVTKSRMVGTGPGKSRFYQVEDVAFVPIHSATPTKEDDTAVKMLQGIFKTRSFFFAENYDITLSCQAQSEADMSLPPWQRAQPDLFWNQHLLGDLTALASTAASGFNEFITPMISGMVKVLPSLVIGEAEFDLLFISRRGCRRVGTRFNKRGIDRSGNVANFAETEQVLLHSDGSVSAFVQVRGSIPVYWNQYVSMRYMPRVKLSASAEESQAAFARHMEALGRYGSVTCVNLIDKKGDQNMLGERFQRAVERLDDTNVKFVWFDFHHECRKMKWGNLSRLVDIVDADVARAGFFFRAVDGQVQRKQLGVLRTNCMDNLDRTNVVQSLFARRFIMTAFGKLDEQTDVLSSRYRSFEKAFKNIWADHADAISKLYSGTGALKTDFTRTGKRTKAGLVQDGYRSVMRYLINNLQDGRTQDAWDLLVGRFQPNARNAKAITTSRRSLTIGKFLQQLFLMFLALMCVAAIFLTPSGYSWSFRISLGYLVAALLFAVVSFLQLKKGVGAGHLFVNKPVLCPHADGRE